MNTRRSMGTARPGRAHRRLLIVALAMALVPTVAACGGQQEQRAAQNLCTQYKELVAAGDELRAMDLRTAKADEVRGRIDTLIAELDQLQAVSEGRYDTLISALRSALIDVKESAVKAGDALDESRNQLQETLQPFKERIASLKERLDTQCNPTTT